MQKKKHMKKENKNLRKTVWVLAVLIIFSASAIGFASEEAPRLPRIYKNGQAETPTVQELGGIGARPLRALVNKNNEARGGEPWVLVHATGTHLGDQLRMELDPPAPGMRVTVYKLFRNMEGDRFFTMPLSMYHGKTNRPIYQEKIAPYRSKYLIVVYEKTGSPEKKSLNQLYFDECMRNLAVTSIKPNYKFCSLKFKMKDLASDEKAFTKDVQELIDRFIEPQRIFVLRLWKWKEKTSEDSQEGNDLDAAFDKK